MMPYPLNCNVFELTILFSNETGIVQKGSESLAGKLKRRIMKGEHPQMVDLA